MKKTEDKIGRTVMNVLRVIEGLGLALIVVGTLFAIGRVTAQVVGAGAVALQDILLLFIYLEIITMVGLYFSSGKLPLRYTLYIAMVAIARYIILGMKGMTGWTVVALSGSVFVLALTTLVIGYGDTKFPNDGS
ncbi:MAG: phosphate-starvation-inducible PsiE family protein [Gammaproteobacteria bacterium]|nr:phosphate-starvation-inducible PsiE family protein [Gammaproteobacteria bacterium]